MNRTRPKHIAIPQPDDHVHSWCVAMLGYGHGVHAPGRSSNRSKSELGDDTTEPWM